jgi:hypothetical protein
MIKKETPVTSSHYLHEGRHVTGVRHCRFGTWMRPAAISVIISLINISQTSANPRPPLIDPQNTLESELIADVTSSDTVGSPIKLHDALMTAYVWIAVDKTTHDNWATHQGQLGNVTYSAIELPDHEKEIALYTNVDRMKYLYPKGTFAISLPGRSAFSLAAQNHQSVVLNYGLLPSINWSRREVVDFISR